jgi:hypothetical protein
MNKVIARPETTGKEVASRDRLLVLACSQRKTAAQGILAAIDRYDGPAFRVLRKYLRNNSDRTLVVLILSAKYGLIGSDCAIPYYDRRLSHALAERMRPQLLKSVRRVLESRPWQEVALCAGKEYRLALGGIAELIPDGAQFDLLGGGLGKRLAALRDWLQH